MTGVQTCALPISSGLSGFASFSGGSCTNCGVAVNALTNTAAIAGGLSGSPSGDGIQILNLNTNTFQTPFGTNQEVSEDISIDPGRNLILSPNEGNNYVLLSLNSSTGAITGELDRSITTGGEPDSAAEDCSTGVALSSVEFTNNVYLADLSQATLTPGSPGTHLPHDSPSKNSRQLSACVCMAAGAPGAAP